MNLKSRPDKVSTAIKLFGIAFVLVVISAILNAPILLNLTSIGFVIISYLFSFAFFIFFVYMIWRGKNWARITFLILFIIGVPISIASLISTLITSPITAIIGMAIIILELIAYLFLFQKPSSDWFKSVKRD